ncbi:pentatricopeptide repeat-containing protein At4g02750-like [Salvia miltiorrhiza]|uniref:pentatricopeptide repeat-containing protein At4g02750-like n=1 Tax=Salvia miltiorrhiza TaxID=226208 RepID=UPI0025AC91E5|nr:pentatricopeptide repeat-containing protein At4g02750-like [Salvia miltiorrhiza]
MDEAKRIIHEMPVKNVVSWTTILFGYALNGLMDEATRIFNEMHVKNDLSWNTFLYEYVQNGLMDKARRVFDEMARRDSISWTTMIAGYSQNGGEEALRFFIEATKDWKMLNNYAFASVLSLCADIAAFELGKQIHGRVVKGGFEFKCNVGSALVSIYYIAAFELGKQIHGRVVKGYDVFKRIEDKDVIYGGSSSCQGGRRMRGVFSHGGRRSGVRRRVFSQGGRRRRNGVISPGWILPLLSLASKYMDELLKDMMYSKELKIKM